MNKTIRFVLVFFLSMISLVLIVVAIVPLRLLLRFVLNAEFPKLIDYDFSGIWAYQTMVMRPIGIGVTGICAVWAAILYVSRMRIVAWVFIFLLLSNLLITFTGLPTATVFYGKKSAARKTVTAIKQDIAQKREDARKKLGEISKLDLSEQGTVLANLNSPRDSSLIPEWEAFGKRVVDFVPDDKTSSSRSYLLRDVIDALGQYYDDPEALAAIEAIEKELRETGAPKKKILFSTIFIGKQKAVNPPYRILTEAAMARQTEMKRIYLETERALEDLRLSGNLVEEGRKLMKLRLYEDALEKYRQALSGPYVNSEADAMDAGRGFADALILAGKPEKPEDWKTAIYWQKLVLKKGIGIQWINKEIIKLWRLYDSYGDQCRQDNIPIDPKIVEWKFIVDGESKRKELEEEYKQSEDKSYLFWYLGDYYYRNLNYEPAEQALLDGIKHVKDLKASGNPANRSAQMEEYMFRDLLKNLYVIMGEYDKAIEQVEEVKSIMAKKPKDRYYSKQNSIIFDEKQDHYILALKYARDQKIPPKELQYTNDSDYSFIEFDVPGWVTWNQKYKFKSGGT